MTIPEDVLTFLLLLGLFLLIADTSWDLFKKYEEWARKQEQEGDS